MKTYLLSALLILFGPAAPAQEEEAAAEEQTTQAETSSKAKTSSKAETSSKAKTLCDLPDLGSDSWIDRMHRAIYRSVCGSAYWFDNFFGEETADYDRNATFGRIALGPEWSEHDDFTVRSRFKVKIHLPRFEKRLNAFFGSYEEDEFAPDRSDNFGSLPDVFRDATDREWLVGLGYSPASDRHKRLDVDAGVKIDSPLDPFVRVRMRRQRFLGDLALLRFRQTVFWRGEKGVGTTTRVDVERMLGPAYHVRWRNQGTVAESIDGVDWDSSLTLYHYLGSDRALAYELLVEGETEADVAVEELGLRTIYRQSLFREWFFAEIRGSLTWPREEPGEARKASLGLGFGFELLFGNHP